MRNLARDMAFMIKSFKNTKNEYDLPKQERDFRTSFPDGK